MLSGVYNCVLMLYIYFMQATATTLRRSPYDLPAPAFYVWYVVHTLRTARSVERVISR